MENNTKTKVDTETEFEGGSFSIDDIINSSSSKKTDVSLDEDPTDEVEEQETQKAEEKPKEAGENKEEGGEEVEEPQEEVERPKEDTTEDNKNTDQGSTRAYETAMHLIDNGALEDFEIQLEDDGDPIKLSDFKNMEDKHLQEILQMEKDDAQKDISENYISKEGLDDYKLKIIDILRNGGDLSDIADDNNTALSQPFEGYDIEDKQDQVNILFYDFVNTKGLSENKAKALIKQSIQDETLKEEAEEVFGSYREQHKKYLSNIADKKKEENKRIQNERAQNTKRFESKLEESGVKSKAAKKAAKGLFDEDENGEYHIVNNLKKALENPEENYQLILHAIDRDLFEKVVKVNGSREVAKEVRRLASGSSKKPSKNRTENSKERKNLAPWEKGLDKLELTR